MIGIYKITNKENGMVYIGQATNIQRRLGEHKKERYVPIDMWINVLGTDAFEYEVLEECEKEDLDRLEQYYITYYDSQKNGYNKQAGGYNNSVGEGNGRALITEEDVIIMREAYANHEAPSEVFNTYFKNKITKGQFQSTWQGRSWSHIMPEVFTEENKQYYKTEMCKRTISLTKDEVFQLRKYYVNHQMDEVWEYFCSIKGDDFMKKNTFKKIMWNDVRENSQYKEVPVYHKKTKQWLLNGEPVSTIPETWE